MAISGNSTFGYASGPLNAQYSLQDGRSAGVALGNFKSELGEEGSESEVDFGPAFLGLSVPSSGNFEMGISVGATQSFDLGVVGKLKFQEKLEIPQITLTFSGEISKEFEQVSTDSGTLNQESGSFKFSDEQEAYENAGIYTPGLVWTGIAYKLEADFNANFELVEESIKKVKITLTGNINLSLRPVFEDIDRPAPPIPPYHPFPDPSNDKKQNCREKIRVYDATKSKINEIAHAIAELLKSIEQERKSVEELRNHLSSDSKLLSDKISELHDILAEINKKTDEVATADSVCEGAKAAALAATAASVTATGAAMAADSAAAVFLGTNPILDAIAAAATATAVTAAATAAAATAAEVAAAQKKSQAEADLAAQQAAQTKAENERNVLQNRVNDWQTQYDQSNEKLSSHTKELESWNQLLGQATIEGQKALEDMSKACIMKPTANMF